MKRNSEAKGRVYRVPKKYPLRPFRRRPVYPINIKYLLNVPNLFSKNQFKKKKDDGHLFVPKCFSLIQNYEESFDFLKHLFVILDRNNLDNLIIDYERCERIDVDASMCMDVILMEFIFYINECRKLGYKAFKGGITPINYEKENIIKVLFSIGAYKNIKGVSIKFSDVEALPVLINDKRDSRVWARSEIDQTRIVEYIKSCLNRFGRELSIEAETSFYKVIGEVMSNAEEHGTMPQRFAIGFFQEKYEGEDHHFGIFNFSIFNFGDTIYESFKNEKCANKKAVGQMNRLSDEYTKRGWFRKAAFEEETLWTLYALQEGVTSKEEKRGNGSIQFIENFFKLKGDMERDDISRLVMISGNTRIIFDGTYSITKKNSMSGANYKMITFNQSGEISDEPDQKFVTFVPYFFPGTMISARIMIDFNNTKSQGNGK